MQEEDLIADLQNEFSLDDALEASFMVSKLPYDKVVEQIDEFHQKKKMRKLTMDEKKELKRIKRIKITRDYRTRQKMKSLNTGKAKPDELINQEHKEMTTNSNLKSKSRVIGTCSTIKGK